jgi:hypothetical protein
VRQTLGITMVAKRSRRLRLVTNFDEAARPALGGEKLRDGSVVKHGEPRIDPFGDVRAASHHQFKHQHERGGDVVGDEPTIRARLVRAGWRIMHAYRFDEPGVGSAKVRIEVARTWGRSSIS